MSETPPPSLATLQSWMQNALVFPRHTDPGEIARIIDPTERLTSRAQLAIYQRSYYLRLLKCMEEQFPALCHALGQELFRDFARQFLQALPSVSYTLYELGARFPGYLEDTRPDRDETEDQRESWVDFMIDLARFERAVFVMFDAPGHEGKPFADEHVPDRRLGLQPCFALHEFRFPVGAYYHQVRAEDDPPFPPRQGSFVALMRIDYLTRTIPLSEVHYRFLKFLAEGRDVQGALHGLSQETGRTLEDVSRAWADPDGVRKHWIAAGFFIDVGCKR